MAFDLVLSVGISLVSAMVISFLATPLVKEFAQLIGAIDVPNEARRVHDHPIPRLGGLAIFLGFILSVVCFAKVDLQVRGILLGAVLIVLLGAVDDIVPLPALLKFAVQIVAALIAVYHGVVINIISNPNIFSDAVYLPLRYFSIPITVIWIVAITNSVNLIDGLDGLAVGVSTISSIAILIISLVVADINVALILASLAGACIGFLPYNFNPAKIFMGDTGALLLGYVLATVSIMGLFKFYAIISFAVPFLVIGLPLFDTAFAFFRRLLTGRNPMSPDRGHVHHRLIDMGLSQKQTVVVLYTISAVLGLAAVLITTSGEMRALLFVVAIVVTLVIAGVIVRGHHHHKSDAEAHAENHDDSGDASCCHGDNSDEH